jgi:UDP-N-acetylmuramoyl-L-alanyl-D-glutamate--2,6-diaminopimelate ligase
VPIPGGPRPAHVVPRPLAGVAAHLGPHLGLPPAVEEQGDASPVQVTGVTLSSRTVRPGDLYAALPGARTHGAEFTRQAAQAGAVAVLTDPAGVARAQAAGLPVLVVPDPRAVLGRLAAWVYGEPGDRLVTLGVTGTNGKTTTTCLLDAALRAAGRRTGLVGTVELRLGDERLPSTGTTPEAPDLHALLAAMVERGVAVCSMEVSSHALALHRVDGLVLDVAAFTNLSQDHLDFHGSMDAYFAAKASLFTPQRSRRGVVCVDDVWGERLAGLATVPVVPVATRPGALPGGAGWRVLEERLEAGLPVARVAGPGGREVCLRSPLPGRFNLANALLALAVLVEAGLEPEQAADAVAAAGPVPGRMERVGEPGVPPGAPLAVVDFAHSPDAVEQALAALLGAAPVRGRPVVVVLGAGGDRDREKRPLMGAAAARGADVVVVTDDNPRSEDPAVIRAAVLDGAVEVARDSGALVLEVPGRRDAISEGVRRAWGGGVVLVAGKGHEQGQEVGGVVHPFDDRAALAAALAGALGERTHTGSTQQEGAR